MIKKIKRNWRFILEIVVFFALFFVVLRFAGSKDSINSVKQAYQDSKFWGAITFMFYLVLSQVFAPLTGGSIIFMAAVVFGPVDTLLYTNIAVFFSATISFYLARIFGRKTVIIFAGQKYINWIDKIAENYGIKMLVLTRTLGFPLFDYVSYAFGLSNISYVWYIIISVLSHILTSTLMVYFFLYFQIEGWQMSWNIILMYVGFVLLSSVFMFVFKKKLFDVK